MTENKDTQPVKQEATFLNTASNTNQDMNKETTNTIENNEQSEKNEIPSLSFGKKENLHNDFSTVQNQDSLKADSALLKEAELAEQINNEAFVLNTNTKTQHTENTLQNTEEKTTEKSESPLETSPTASSSTENTVENTTEKLAEEALLQDNPEEDNTKKSKKKKKARVKQSPMKFLLKFIFFSVNIGVALAIIIVYGVIQWASADLPSITKVADFRPPLTTTILARDGSVMGELYNEQRYLITVDELPDHVTQAFISAEDKTFFDHPGINPIAILRAAITNFTSGSTQGASTITQQVVKRLLLTPEKTYTRKIKEMLLAFQLERQLSKKDILTIYLNQIHVGGRSYGIEAGARYYFAKHAKDLSIAEAALIAGILPATTRFNPYRDYNAARNRQEYVLGRMREDGKITDAEYEEAFYEIPVFKKMEHAKVEGAEWYLEEVRRQLIELFSEENAKQNGLDYGVYGEQAVYELGLTIKTAMDPAIQLIAEKSLRKGLESSSKRYGWQGPVENIMQFEFASYLEKNPFTLSDLENNNWVKVLVTDVTAKGAKVSLGEYQGYISVNTMGWARKHNPKVTGYEDSTNIKNATSVLKVGDIVYASFNPPATTKKNPDTLLLSEITKQTVIPLALQQKPEVQGALISIEPKTSDVVALVGGYDFGLASSHFNRATQAKRQPGSAFKPFVYSAALDQGFTLTSEILDAPIVFIDPYSRQMWRPSNFDQKFDGRMPFITALKRSRNLATVRVAQQIGMESVIQRARDLGLKGELPPHIAASLGSIEVTPLEMAVAYTAFANQGLLSKPRFIQSIIGPWGNEVYVNQNEYTQAISPQNAYLMSAMLEEVVKSGTGSQLKKLEIPLGGKTGTTNEEMDAWFIGVTPNIVTATYIGYDWPKPMGRGETGSRAALPIFKSFAEEALPLYPSDLFTVPEGIYFVGDEENDGAGIPFAEGTSPNTSIHAVTNEEQSADVKQAEDLLKQIF